MIRKGAVDPEDGATGSQQGVLPVGAGTAGSGRRRAGDGMPDDCMPPTQSASSDSSSSGWEDEPPNVRAHRRSETSKTSTSSSASRVSAASDGSAVSTEEGASVAGSGSVVTVLRRPGLGRLGRRRSSVLGFGTLQFATGRLVGVERDSELLLQLAQAQVDRAAAAQQKAKWQARSRIVRAVMRAAADPARLAYRDPVMEGAEGLLAGFRTHMDDPDKLIKYLDGLGELVTSRDVGSGGSSILAKERSDAVVLGSDGLLAAVDAVARGSLSQVYRVLSLHAADRPDLLETACYCVARLMRTATIAESVEDLGIFAMVLSLVDAVKSEPSTCCAVLAVATTGLNVLQDGTYVAHDGKDSTAFVRRHQRTIVKLALTTLSAHMHDVAAAETSVAALDKFVAARPGWCRALFTDPEGGAMAALCAVLKLHDTNGSLCSAATSLLISLCAFGPEALATVSVAPSSRSSFTSDGSSDDDSTELEEHVEEIRKQAVDGGFVLALSNLQRLHGGSSTVLVDRIQLLLDKLMGDVANQAQALLVHLRTKALLGATRASAASHGRGRRTAVANRPAAPPLAAGAGLHGIGFELPAARRKRVGRY